MKLKNISIPMLFIALGGVVSSFVGPETFARWQRPEEADSTIELYHTDIEVDKEGSSRETITLQQTLHTEGSKNQFSPFRIYFDKSYQKVVLNEAYTLDEKGNKTKVNPELISQRDADPDPNGFDSQCVYQIGFPNIAVNHSVYLKYTITSNPEKIAPKEFSLNKHCIGYSKKTSLGLRSKIPLFFKVNDPQEKFKVTAKDGSEETGFHAIDIVLQSPIQTSTMMELGMLNPKNVTSIVFDSYRDSQKKFHHYIKRYDAILEKPLPKRFQSIVEKVKALGKDVEKDYESILSTVMAEVMDQVHYLGDWRSIKGSVIPRGLKKVEDTGVGDCKDFASLTVKILRELGYKAYIALVKRTPYYLPETTLILPVSQSNHAFVFVQLPSGKELWLDPTNVASTTNLLPDIEGRPAFVMMDGQLVTKQVPVSKDNSVESTYVLTFSKQPAKDGIRKKCHVSLDIEEYSRGSSAMFYYAMGRYIRDFKSFEEHYVKMIGQYFGAKNTALKGTVRFKEEDPMKTRIVKPVRVSAHISDISSILQNSNRGLQLKLPTGQVMSNFVTFFQKDCVTDLPLEEHMEFSKTFILKNVTLSDTEGMNVVIDSPWYRVERKAQVLENGDIKIQVNSLLKRQFVTAEERNSKEFQDFVESLESDFVNYSLEIKVKDTPLSKDV